MKRKISGLGICFGLVFWAASAGAMSFDISGADSEVNLDIVWTLPPPEAGLTGALVPNLDSTVFDLGDGESFTFDFFTLTILGTGWGEATITATLAFDEPAGAEAIADGSIGWSAGYEEGGDEIVYGIALFWEDTADPIHFMDGSWIDVSFDDGFLSLSGDTATVQATVTMHVAPVPLPGTILLMGTGLAGLVIYGRKRFTTKS